MMLSNVTLAPHEMVPQEEAIDKVLSTSLGMCLLLCYMELRDTLMDIEGVINDTDLKDTRLLQWQGQMLHDTFNLYPVDIEECIKRYRLIEDFSDWGM